MKDDEAGRPVQPDALFRAAADQAPQVMWIVNPKGAVTYLNRYWYQLVGGSPPKWYGHEWGETVVPEDLAEMRRRWLLAKDDGSLFHGTRRVYAQDGTLRVLQYKATPIRDDNGRITCWVGMDADITEITLADEALKFVNRELETFAYSVSHDLRSPLATIHGFAHLLTKHLVNASDPKLVHYADRIMSAAADADRLIDGLLVLSQVARSTMKVEDIDLSRMASDILERHQKSRPDSKLEAAVQPGMKARGDSRLVAVLLENLIGNAVKFSARVEAPRVEVRHALGTTAGADQVFAVADNGAGFRMEDAAKLFLPFSRLHSEDDFEGTGIGLATVQRIVHRHGGLAWAESEPGKGAKLYFTLPRR